MTQDQKLVLMRNLTGEEDDELLLTFLASAGEVILNRLYPFKTDEELEGVEVPNRYHNLQCTIASYLIDRIGTLGETKHVEGVVSREYASANVPEAYLKQITPVAKPFKVG